MSENLTLQNLLKTRKLLPTGKFENTLPFNKKSKRKVLSLISAESFMKNNLYVTLGFKFLLWLNRKLFDCFNKTSFRYYEFSVAINVFM